MIYKLRATCIANLILIDFVMNTNIEQYIRIKMQIKVANFLSFKNEPPPPQPKSRLIHYNTFCFRWHKPPASYLVNVFRKHWLL
jgi:hypothetical protein